MSAQAKRPIRRTIHDGYEYVRADEHDQLVAALQMRIAELEHGIDVADKILAATEEMLFRMTP